MREGRKETPAVPQLLDRERKSENTAEGYVGWLACCGVGPVSLSPSKGFSFGMPAYPLIALQQQDEPRRRRNVCFPRRKYMWKSKSSSSARQGKGKEREG